MIPPPPEKLEAQVIDLQHSVHFQFLRSLLRFVSGWFANHALQGTRRVGRSRGPDSRMESARPNDRPSWRPHSVGPY
jgi:hypothetical protein